MFWQILGVFCHVSQHVARGQSDAVAMMKVLSKQAINISYMKQQTFHIAR